jgi:hypothetical protein
VNGYLIATGRGRFICVTFGSGLSLPVAADDADADELFPIGDTFLGITIDEDGSRGKPIVYNLGAVATRNQGKTLRALLLLNSEGQSVFFSECGPFVVQDGETDTRASKRALVPTVGTTGSGTFNAVEADVTDDPHIAGAHGIKFDVFGAPGANYSLLVAPAFEVNMQLAKRGPELRFMTSMTVLYRGKSFTITPTTAKEQRDELISHFESLDSKVSIKNWRTSHITIELCDGHAISFETHRNNGISFLNFEMQVPGCLDSYGGLLGQTYQCKYATEGFEWSRAREEEFRIATLETSSGAYSPDTKCAHENEYRGEPMRAGSFVDEST